MTAPERTITYVPLAEVTPADRNAKAHDDQLIRSSVERFGFTAPLVVDERTGKLVAGHGRLQAVTDLHAAGKPVPDGIRDDGGTWAVPVVRGWSSRDDAHADALAIADNKLTEAGGWDDRLLAELLEDVAERDPDLLAVTGFTQDDLDALIADATTSGGPGGGLDEETLERVPEVAPGPPVTQLGDVWQLGPHRVICGDSTDPTVLAELLGGDRPQALVTDPPYGVDYEPEDSGRVKGSARIVNDGFEDAHRMVAAALSAAVPLSDPQATAYVFAQGGGPNAARTGRIYEAVVAAGWTVANALVWDKTFPGRGTRWRYSWELVIEARAGKEARWLYGRDKRNVLNGYLAGPYAQARDPIAWEHPTPKPARLMADLIGGVVEDGQVVLDQFAGSGATLMGAHSIGRVARLVELEARYVDVICRRWQHATGEVPVLQATGQPHDFAAQVPA